MQLLQQLEQTPKSTASKLIACAGCATLVSVSKNVCFAYCADCSARNLGRKK